MKRLLLNSRITWIVLPLVMTGLVYLAATRARQPLSDRAVDRLLGRLYQNALDDPKIPWGNMVPYNFILQINTLKSATQLVPYFDITSGLFPIANAVALAEEKANLFTKTEAACFADVRAFLDSQPNALFPFRKVSLHPHEWLLQLGAIMAARAGDNEKALTRLQLLTRLSDMSMARFTGKNAQEVIILYTAFEDVAAETTSPVHLRRLSEELERTRSLQQPTRPAVGAALSHLVYQMKFEPEVMERREIVKTIAYSANGLVTEKPYEVSRPPEFDWVDAENYDVGNLIPWTRSPFLFKKAMNDLSEQPLLTAAAPDAYLKGLSGEQRLMGAALLLEPHEDQKSNYMSDRANATRREMMRAALLARVYYSEHGVMPTRLEDLSTYGFVPPPSTDVAALRTTLHAMRGDANLPNRDVSLGPLEIAQVVPAADELDPWLDGGTMINLQSVSEGDEGSTLSLRRISLAPDTNFGTGTGYEDNLRRWIDRLDSRPDVRVTSYRIYTDERDEWARIDNRHGNILRRRVRATVEFIAPTQITKIQLRDPRQELPFPRFSKARRPQPMYLAPPLPPE